MRCTLLEKKLIIKMIKNCFKQYYSEVDLLPMNSEDLEELADRIIQIKAEQPAVDLYEAVNDTVYEFLTG
ncbi:YqzH family protein [Neobacillus niacini]|uniref:YqzH family protein n=1 Tax=Neobacillus niacini TaxID=86668 RepID=UPI0039833141